MILDINNTLSAAQAVTVTAVSDRTFDTAGLGIGNPVTNAFGLQNASFGQDIGGGGPGVSSPQLLVQVGTAFTAGGSATFKAQLQCAVDVANTGLPVTWDTIVETDTIAVALLTAGAQVAAFNVPDRYLGQGFPRFYRVNYVVATGPMTAGTVNAFFATGIDDALRQIYPSAF